MDLSQLLAGLGSNPALANAASAAGLAPAQAQSVVHGVAEHVQGGGGLENLVESVAGRVGLPPAQVQAFLPQVLPLIEQHLATASAERQAPLNNLLGALGGVLGQGGGGAGAPTATGILGGMFGRPG